jgi:membrane protein DedA with SNARE-associated domain
VSFDLIAPLLATYGYPILFIAICLECAALPIPGELLLLALGGLAAQGHLDPSLGVLIAALAAVLGDSISYGAGRRWGPDLIDRIRVARRWTPGPLTIIFGRFVVGARVAVAPLAGAQRVGFGRFVLFDALGAMLWAALFVVAGYVGAVNIAVVQRHWAVVTGGVALVVVAAAVIAYMVRDRTERSPEPSQTSEPATPIVLACDEPATEMCVLVPVGEQRP